MFPLVGRSVRRVVSLLNFRSASVVGTKYGDIDLSYSSQVQFSHTLLDLARISFGLYNSLEMKFHQIMKYDRNDGAIDSHTSSRIH